MAEAAGLALSGIAFTSLVTSCVDILEYFDNGRHWIHDLSLALTKVSLLKVRLGQLRNSLPLDTVDGFSSDTCHIHVAMRGLSDVDSVLEQTNELCKRYSYLPLRNCEPITAISSAEVCHIGQSHHQRHGLRDAGMQRGKQGGLRAWHRLGKKVCWAIQDKRRFDRLVSDLESLLSSIEKLASSLQGGDADYGTPTPPSPAVSVEKEPQNSLHTLAHFEQKGTIGRPVFHHNQDMLSLHSASSKNISPNTESQLQTRPNMSAKRVSQPGISTPKTEDKFIRNKVEQAGLIWRGSVSTSEGGMVTSGSVYAEENEVRGSVMVLGAQTSSDLDKVLNHLKDMRRIEVSVGGVSPS